jgi:hypothetical protein
MVQVATSFTTKSEIACLLAEFANWKVSELPGRFEFHINRSYEEIAEILYRFSQTHPADLPEYFELTGLPS